MTSLASQLILEGQVKFCCINYRQCPSTKKTDYYTTFAKMRNGGKGRG